MIFLCATPDENYGTLAEVNGSLVSLPTGNTMDMQELVNTTTLYPSIVFEPIAPVTIDFVNTTKAPSNLLETTYATAVNTLEQQWKEKKPVIEATTAYKQAKEVYNYIYKHYLKAPDMILEHPLFSNQDSIQCMAWHPHLEILAVGHKDNNVYIYEKKDQSWECQVICHEKMENITCISWKVRSAGTLAVGCQRGVCVWTIPRVENKGESKPKYHPNAMMKYLQFEGQDHISSLEWDPTPASQLLAVVSGTSNTLVIYDMLLDKAIPLKRYGKGSILLRWSPSGEWLFEGGSAGLSRMWDTSDWSSQQINNPPGLWIQAACWSPDNRTLVYSMYGKCDVHVLFLSGKFVKQAVKDDKVLSTPSTTVETANGNKVTVGGVIRDITIDPRSGQRLAIAYESSPLIGLYSINGTTPFDVQQNSMLFPIGYIRAVQMDSALEMKTMDDAKPLSIKFSSTFKEGAVMAVAWNNGIVTFVTHKFLTSESFM